MSEQSYAHVVPILATATNDISGANTSRTPALLQSFKVTQIRALITTATTGTASVITVNRETKAGVVTDDIEVGSFTVPTAAAVGDIFYIDMEGVANTELAPGEAYSFLSGGEGDAGVAWFGVMGYWFEEGPTPNRLFPDTEKPRTGQGDIRYLAFTAS